MDDHPRFAPVEVIPVPRRPDSPLLEPGVLRDPGPKPPPIDRPQLLIVSGVVATLLASVVALAILLPGAAEESAPAEAEADLKAALAAPDGDQALIDLETISPTEAQHLVRGTGSRSLGSIEHAWTWTDRNGFNLVTTSRVIRGTPENPKQVTVQVSHLANLDGRPRQLALIQDPVSCDHRGLLRAGFTPGALRVSDLDGDGVAEITADWWFTCGDDQPDGTTVKLALLSNGHAFIERGTGPGLSDSLEPGERILAPLRSFEPEPRESRWPKPFLVQARDLLVALHGDAA